MRAKLYKESFEFVRQQRIHCLLEGAWFMNGIPLATTVPRDTLKRPTRPWRFLRLVREPCSPSSLSHFCSLHASFQDAGLKYLHYVDSAVKFPVRKGLEDLPERIEIAMISEVATGTCAPFPHIRGDQTDLPLGASSPLLASSLSFSLLSTSGGSLADQIAPDQARWADWTDGLNMIRRDGGHVASQETELFVQALTEIGLKIKLLGSSAFDLNLICGSGGAEFPLSVDLSGEKVEIPSGLVAGPPPINSDFFFSDLSYDPQA